MSKHKSHLKRNLIITLIILLLIVTAFTANEYWKAHTKGVHFKKMEYPIRAAFEYHKNLGITDNRSLEFPRIPMGTAVTRDVQLNNIYGAKIRIVPSLEGNVSKYVISSLEQLYLEEGERKKFNVTIYAAGEPGNYTGTLTLDLYRLI